ncbi:MAG: XRE family transcriptional regulator, partial [Planctomycetia bacterium]|nr:XRE family transcriptional regulator [Planctomycetia bacterium]
MGLQGNLGQLRLLRKRAIEMASGASFGARLRNLRKAKGWTLQDLSEATGIAKSYLSQVETGYVYPPRDAKIHLLAAALGADADEMTQWAHATRMPSDIREQMRRLATAFDSAETVIRRLLVRVAQREKQSLEAGADSGRQEPPEIDFESLEASGLLEQIGQWGEVLAEPLGIRQIPVINKVAAGYPQQFTDLDYPAGIADEYIGASAELTDPYAFAVRVVGDSMEPKYREDDIVIFSPSE